MENMQETMKMATKYLLEGVVVGIVAYIVAKKRLNLEEIVIIGLTASSAFALLDIFFSVEKENTFMEKQKT